MQDILLVSFDLEKFPMGSSLAEAEKSTSNINVATNEVKFDIFLGSSVYFLASEVQLPEEVAVIENLFSDSFLPSIEELSYCCLYSSNGDSS